MWYSGSQPYTPSSDDLGGARRFAALDPADQSRETDQLAASTAPDTVALPRDAILHIYQLNYASYASRFQSLGLKDRMRGMAVCKAWRAALQDAVLPALTVSVEGGEDIGHAAAWLACTPQGTQQLTVGSSLCILRTQEQEQAMALLQRALRSCEGEVLRVLQYNVLSSSFPRLVPHPHQAFPSLRHLNLNLTSPSLDAGWVARLGLLPHLKSLRLKEQEGCCRVAAPAAPCLTSLDLHFAEVVVDLAGLPSLLRLELTAQGARGASITWGGSKGCDSASRAASACTSTSGSGGGGGGMHGDERGASPLQELRVGGLSRLEFDFALAPQLRRLYLYVSEVEGAASISAATSLTWLCLEGNRRVAQQLLDALPCEALQELHFFRTPAGRCPADNLRFASLRRLKMHPGEGADAGRACANALALLTHLESLELHGACESAGGVPPHPTLTHLLLDNTRGSITVDLAVLPSLKALELRNCPGGHHHITSSTLLLLPGSAGGSTRGGVDASGSGCVGAASLLRQLSSWAQHLTLDFAAMPHLEWLDLSNLSRLHGAPGIAAATGLRGLCLQTSDSAAAAALLRAAPRSVCAASVGLYNESWLAEGVAEALKGMTQLRVLALHKEEVTALLGAGSVLGPGAPLWGRLEALSLGFYEALPEGLAGATQLRCLQTGSDLSSSGELALLGKLAALRTLHLCGVFRSQLPAAARVYAMLPGLELLDTGSFTHCAPFLKQWLGL